ncbi:hypothetical protein AB0O47_39990, partial [Streptomyces noursei]
MSKKKGTSPYGRIRRGPMAADVFGEHFTQVFNHAVRDKRLSRRARGLLTELLSHRDGYGVTVASLVKEGTEGKAAITTGLKELERFEYLVRDRDRDEKGQLGDSVYYVTDMPASLLLALGLPWSALAELVSGGTTPPELEGESTSDQNPRSERRKPPTPELESESESDQNPRSEQETAQDDHGVGADVGAAGASPELEGESTSDQNPRSEQGSKNRTLEGSDQKRRSEPKSDYPALGKPALGNPPTKKNNNLKKNNQEKNNCPPSLPSGPSLGRDVANAEQGKEGKGGRTAAPEQNTEPPAPPEVPGAKVKASDAARTLLVKLRDSDCRLKVTGRALHSYGLIVDGLIAGGWTADDITEQVTANLPKIIEKPGGFVRSRLLSLPDRPVSMPRQRRQEEAQKGSYGPGDPEGHPGSERPAKGAPAAYTDRVADALRVPKASLCQGNETNGYVCDAYDTPVTPPDTQCGACAGWDRCRCGRKYLRPGSTL